MEASNWSGESVSSLAVRSKTKSKSRLRVRSVGGFDTSATGFSSVLFDGPETGETPLLGHQEMLGRGEP